MYHASLSKQIQQSGQAKHPQQFNLLGQLKIKIVHLLKVEVKVHVA